MELRVHWNDEHIGNKFACDLCNKTYTRSWNLKRHKLWDHVNSLDNMKLEGVVCGKLFMESSQLNNH